MGRAGRTLDPTHLMVQAEGRGPRASPGKEERSPRELRTGLRCEEHPGGQRSESAPKRVHTHPLSIPALPPPPILGPRTQGVESIVVTVWWIVSRGAQQWYKSIFIIFFITYKLFIL